MIVLEQYMQCCQRQQWLIIEHAINLVSFAPRDHRCKDEWPICVQVADFRILDVEGCAEGVTGAIEWALCDWRRRDRLVGLVQRAHTCTVRRLPRLPITRDLNLVHRRRHDNRDSSQKCQLQQQRNLQCRAHLSSELVYSATKATTTVYRLQYMFI